MGIHSGIDLGAWARKVRQLTSNPAAMDFTTLPLGNEEPRTIAGLSPAAASVLVPWGAHEGAMELYTMALRPDVADAAVTQRCMTLHQHTVVEGRYNAMTTPEERAAHKHLENRSFAIAFQQGMSEPIACVVYAVDPGGRPFDVLHYHKLLSPHWCFEQILSKIHLA